MQYFSISIIVIPIACLFTSAQAALTPELIRPARDIPVLRSKVEECNDLFPIELAQFGINVKDYRDPIALAEVLEKQDGYAAHTAHLSLSARIRLNKRLHLYLDHAWGKEYRNKYQKRVHVIRQIHRSLNNLRSIDGFWPLDHPLRLKKSQKQKDLDSNLRYNVPNNPHQEDFTTTTSSHRSLDLNHQGYNYYHDHPSPETGILFQPSSVQHEQQPERYAIPVSNHDATTQAASMSTYSIPSAQTQEWWSPSASAHDYSIGSPSSYDFTDEDYELLEQYRSR